MKMRGFFSWNPSPGQFNTEQWMPITGALIQKKISMLGDFSTGKTSLVRRFVYNSFDERYMSTLGVQISRKVVDLADARQMNLLIWDLSGNEKFDGARADYIRGSSGALLVCDLSRPETVERLDFFRQYLYISCPNIPVVLIGNKSDLVPEGCASIPRVKELAAAHNSSFCITSAKTGSDVESAFRRLAEILADFHD